MASTPEVVKPKQSNYDTYFMPLEIKDIGNGLPLYRLVAFWGLRKGDYICRDDIAAAFGISLRQASGLISSIFRKSSEISCELKRVRSGKGNVIKSYIRIQAVQEKPKRLRTRLATPNLPRKVREKNAQAKGQLLWSQLLSHTSEIQCSAGTATQAQSV